jgi:hypothetical protein
METIQVGDKVRAKTVGSNAYFVVGEVVDVQGKIVHFLLDENQSEYGVRPIFSRLIHQVTKLT